MMANIRKGFPLIFSVLLVITNISLPYARSVEKQTVLAVLSFNVASFTTWPEQTFNHEAATINLCVYGDNIVQQSFESINGKVIHSKTIHLVSISRLRNLEQCQVLYLSKLDRNRITPLIMEIKDEAILTIGESMDFLQAGGMVGLENNGGKMQLIINLPSVKQSGLVINSRLLSLANIVDFPVAK